MSIAQIFKSSMNESHSLSSDAGSDQPGGYSKRIRVSIVDSIAISVKKETFVRISYYTSSNNCFKINSPPPLLNQPVLLR